MRALKCLISYLLSSCFDSEFCKHIWAKRKLARHMAYNDNVYLFSLFGKAQFKRHISVASNSMQFSSNNGFCSIALNLTWQKCDVWTGPNLYVTITIYFTHILERLQDLNIQYICGKWFEPRGISYLFSVSCFDNHITTKLTNPNHNQRYKYHHLTMTLHLTLKMTTAQVS